MDTIEAILTRRSIRKYGKENITDEQIKQLLEAGMSAPSAHNYQPWHFIVIRDRQTLNEIPRFHRFAQMLKEAPAAIVVCGDTGIEQNVDYINQDCSAATQNILLAAHAIGLGAVWLGIFPRDERVGNLKKLLNIPENILPVSIISLGYPAEKKPPAKRYNINRIHYDRW